MFKKLILIILLFSINYLKGAELEIKIAHYPKEVIKGEPCNIRVTISNVSGKEIIIAGGFYGLDKEFIVKRADGRKRKEIISELEKFYTKEYEAKALSSDFKSDFTKNIFERYDDEAGEFIVQFKISSYSKEAWSGSIYKGKKVKTWTGVVYSEEIHIFLKEPTGIDKEAYDYFEGHPLWKKEDLLDKYSTSIYAGWALMSYMPTLSLSINPELLLSEAIDLKPNRALKHCAFEFQKDNEGKTISIFADEIASKYASVASKFLEVHSDFLAAGPIYARLGTAQVILNKWQEAKSSYEQALKASWENIPEIEKRKDQIKKMIELLTGKRLAR
jgi:hypothetical protein